MKNLGELRYEDMIDFEINKQVFEIKTGLKAVKYPHDADNGSVGFRDINDIYHWYDFCNNPSDSWSIILKNKISVGATYDDTEQWVAYAPSKTYFDSNPLRAAMIVYLMMNEGNRDETL